MSNHTLDTRTGLYIWEGCTRKGENHTNLVFQKTPKLRYGKTNGMVWKRNRSIPTQWDAAMADPRFKSRIPDINSEDFSACQQQQVVQIHQHFRDRLLSTKLIHLKNLTLLSFRDFTDEFLTPVTLHGFEALLYHGQSDPTRPDPSSVYSIWLHSNRLQLGSARLYTCGSVPETLAAACT